jgi:uncharacterized protein (TIGR03435 family)
VAKATKDATIADLRLMLRNLLVKRFGMAVHIEDRPLDELATGMRGLAPAYIDKPVVNLTELKGRYDFKLGWTPRGLLLGTDGTRSAAEGGVPGGSINPSEPTAGGMTFFEGVDKYLGLKLASAKHG